MPPDNERGRPSSADLHHTAGNHVSTFLTEPATLGGSLLAVEVDVRGAARRLEHLAVVRPLYGREAAILFLVAGRLRGDRLAEAA